MWREKGERKRGLCDGEEVGLLLLLLHCVPPPPPSMTSDEDRSECCWLLRWMMICIVEWVRFWGNALLGKEDEGGKVPEKELKCSSNRRWSLLHDGWWNDGVPEGLDRFYSHINLPKECKLLLKNRDSFFLHWWWSIKTLHRLFYLIINQLNKHHKHHSTPNSW